MQRELEPELTDTAAEARSCDEMDHSQVNRLFVDDLLATVGEVDSPLSAIDLGTCTALTPIELCKRDARFRVTAVDAAAHILEWARKNIATAVLGEQVGDNRGTTICSACGLITLTPCC